MSARADQVDAYVPERGNPGYEVTAYDLELDYAVTSNRLDGRARITAVAVDDLVHLDLDLTGLRATKVGVDGAAARWRQRGGKLRVTPAAPVGAGAELVVDVRYAGNPGPTRSAWGLLGWEELTDGALVAAQPSGASTWFPCNDLARQKASFRTTVTAASGYHVVAVGELVGTRARGNRTTWTYEQVEPTSPYLATIHVGRYERRALPGARVPIHVVAPPEHRRDVDRAFARQAEMVEAFVDWFGPYPFAAGYTVVVSADPLDVPLEAQGQSAFGVNHLDEASERLIAHELSHQWFGNSLTAGGWHDIWLHEGFACYSEWIWSEVSGGTTAHELARLHHEQLRSLPQDLLLGDPGPADLFDDRVYKRGALTVHALRLELGEEAFRSLLRRWVAEHEHAVVATTDLVALATEIAGRDLQPLFDAWLHQTALPELSGGR